MYCYKQTGSDPNLWTVGFYDPNGEWNAESGHTSWEAAAERVAWLNGSRGRYAPPRHTSEPSEAEKDRQARHRLTRLRM